MTRSKDGRFDEVQPAQTAVAVKPRAGEGITDDTAPGPPGLPLYVVIGLLTSDRPAMGIVMNAIASRK